MHDPALRSRIPPLIGGVGLESEVGAGFGRLLKLIPEISIHLMRCNTFFHSALRTRFWGRVFSYFVLSAFLT